MTTMQMTGIASPPLALDAHLPSAVTELAAAFEDAAICTVFEGDYHLGVGALLNSLHTAGFEGLCWAGHRGPVPPWATIEPVSETISVCRLNDRLYVVFVRLETDTFLTMYKPAFMHWIVTAAHPTLERLFYFDPDIVVAGPWAFFDRWADVGIALVEDCCYARFPATHPMRATWRQLMQQWGLKVQTQPDAYYNAGFVGFRQADFDQIAVWYSIMEAMHEAGLSRTAGKTGRRTDPFYDLDQDALNMLVMSTNRPLSIIGPDGMGFTPPMSVMAHAASTPKPWRSWYLRLWLTRGVGPSELHKAFWRHADGPVRLFSAMYRRLKWLDLRAASAIARYLGRGR